MFAAIRQIAGSKRTSTFVRSVKEKTGTFFQALSEKVPGFHQSLFAKVNFGGMPAVLDKGGVKIV